MERRRFFPARPVQQVPGRRVELEVQLRPAEPMAPPPPPPAPCPECPPPVLGWAAYESWDGYDTRAPYASWHGGSIDGYAVTYWTEKLWFYGVATDGAPFNLDTDAIELRYTAGFLEDAKLGLEAIAAGEVDRRIDLISMVRWMMGLIGGAPAPLGSAFFIVLTRQGADVGYLTAECNSGWAYPELALKAWRAGSPDAA